MAESTRHPGEKPLLSVRGQEREGPDQRRVNLQLLHKAREGPLERLEVTMKEWESEWALPQPSDPRGPPKAEIGGEGGKLSGQPETGWESL